MAERIDIETTRQTLIEAFTNLPIPEGVDADTIRRCERLRRGARMCAEIVCFGLAECERDGDGDIRRTIEGIADVVGNALHHIADDVGAENDPTHEAEHQAIHVITDSISRTMHSMYYALHRPGETGAMMSEPVVVSVTRKTLADA